MEKKPNGRCAKIILLSLKKVDARKEIFFFILSNCHGNAFFMEEFKWKILTNRNFADFGRKTLCI